MSRPRTPAHFPRMKHRAAKRRLPRTRLWDKDWNLLATATTHAERRALIRQLREAR